MSDKPVLILHIGPGKTGTSAIQHWLLSQADELRDQGYFYPVPSSLGLFEGNASALAQILLKSERIEECDLEKEILNLLATYVDNLRLTPDNTLLLSAEQMAGVTAGNLRIFNEIAGRLFSVKIIMSVRHPYPWLWSVWGQFVKRSAEHRKFNVFADTNIRAYNSLVKFLEIFDNVILLPYSNQLIIGEFARAIGIDVALLDVTSAQSQKINRSLTRSELDFLLSINRICKSPRVSTRISDYMIMRRPDEVAHLEVNSDVLNFVEHACKSTIQRFEKLSPGSTGWCPENNQHDLRSHTKNEIVVTTDVLEYSLKVVEQEIEERILADLRSQTTVSAAQISSEYVKPRWPAFIRIPYRWIRKKKASLAGGRKKG